MNMGEGAVEQQDAADEVRAFTMAALAADLGVRRTLMLSRGLCRRSVVCSLFLITLACRGHEDRFLRNTDHDALLAACRRAIATLPPSGPAIDPLVYAIDPGDPRWTQLAPALQARTVTFARVGKNLFVTDPRLPAEILRIEPLFVTVTPDAIHVALCGAGLSCSAGAIRQGATFAALRAISGGEPDCTALRPGLWYCHE
jgi:hypothetical protein